MNTYMVSQVKEQCMETSEMLRPNIPLISLRHAVTVAERRLIKLP